MTAASASSPPQFLRRMALALGPGLVVMLADTDAGSVITAAQSGAQWGYRLLAPQILLIPVLFAMQELTIRLGFATGLGFAELIRVRFGRAVAYLALATLIVSCFGALVTQLAALGGLAAIFGASPAVVVIGTVLFFIAIAMLGAYASVERIAIALGLFELAFVIVAWRAGPKLDDMLAQVDDWPIYNSRYLYLLAANLGTTLMPWAAFYQQSAMVDKNLQPSRITEARLETLGGAALCQLITAAILVAGAAALGGQHGGTGFGAIADIADAFTRALGPGTGRIIFALGLCGSALVAALVVTLTVAWAVGEVVGVRHSLGQSPRGAPWFYVPFVAMLVVGGAVVVLGADPVSISIAVGAVNALLLPIVLALLYALARRELAGPLALSPAYSATLAIAFVAVSAVSLYSGLRGFLG